MGWSTDMTHYLDENGLIPAMPVPAARLASYFGSIVAAASSPGSSPIRCRRRPGHRACAGTIVAEFEAATNNILGTVPSAETGA